MSSISNEQIAHDIAIALLPKEFENTESNASAVSLYKQLYKECLAELSESDDFTVQV